MAKGVGMSKIGPDEHDHPGNPDHQPELAAARDVMVAEQQAIEHQKPERRNRNQQRRQASGNDLLRVRKREIAAHQKQNADNREMAELACRKTNAASGQRAVGEHHHARNQEARGAHHARRNLLYRDADAQISRAPEDVDQAKGKNNLPSVWGCSAAHGMEKIRISERAEENRAIG